MYCMGRAAILLGLKTQTVNSRRNGNDTAIENLSAAYTGLLLHAQSMSTRSIPIQWTRVEIQSPGDSLDVVLPSGAGSWIVGAKVTEGAKDHVEIADVDFIAGGPIPRMNGVRAHAGTKWWFLGLPSR